MLKVLIIFLCLCIPVLDGIKKINITGKWFRIPMMLVLPQFLLIWGLCTGYGLHAPGMSGIICSVCMILFYCYALFRFHITPDRRDAQCPSRLRILYGGQLLLRFSVWGFFVQGIFYLLLVTGHIPPVWSVAQTNPVFFTISCVLCVLFLFFLLVNGQFRILFTCYRLGIVKRILILLCLWIPVVNLFLMHYMCRKAVEEYDHERCRFTARAERADSNVCSTRYPLIMVHGIGFRDLRYFNYWGRIPKELTRNGAVVYYGHQEAWGTIEDNAVCIKEKMEQVMKENNCDKVNIIAHSKGGLDARYLISRLGMAKQVASLTTVSTPHLGSELINVLNRLPDKMYRMIASWFDRTFSRFGDRNPDCYHASKQLAPSFCQEFNEQTPNRPSVYYQSYASVMKHTSSDSLLAVPHLIMDLTGAKQNDGLVTEGSAKWGEFKGTFRNKYRRGISHGDMIDLKREDYRGFDVIETYVQIVSGLKNMGF